MRDKKAEEQRLLAKRAEIIEIIDTLNKTISTSKERGDLLMAGKLTESRSRFRLQLIELEVQLTLLRTE